MVLNPSRSPAAALRPVPAFQGPSGRGPSWQRRERAQWAEPRARRTALCALPFSGGGRSRRGGAQPPPKMEGWRGGEEGAGWGRGRPALCCPPGSARPAPGAGRPGRTGRRTSGDAPARSRRWEPLLVPIAWLCQDRSHRPCPQTPGGAGREGLGVLPAAPGELWEGGGGALG